MSTVRLRRLAADYDRIRDYVRRHPRVKLIQAEGSPPEKYQLQYVVRSLKQSNGEVVIADSHLIEIVLPRNYPRTPPQCRMLSPVFHPNIAPHAICVGDHWGAGETLDSIVIRIGEMLAYQSYNVKSPLNGEAARWVEGNLHQVPTDTVSLLPEGEAMPTAAEGGASDSHSSSTEPRASSPPPATSPPPFRPTFAAAPPSPAAPSPAAPVAFADQTPQSAEETPEAEPPSPPRPTAPAPSPDRMRIVCPNCQKAYSLPVELRGRTAKCTSCHSAFKLI